MLSLLLIVIILSSVTVEVNGGILCKQLEANIMKKINPMANTLKRLEAAITKIIDPQKAKDCADLFKRGIKQNGAYTVQPRDGGKPIKVYCDMKTDGGGWTVFQTRKDGSVNFYRGWNDYKHGFGSLYGEFWLGNNNLNRLTNQDSYQLRVDLEDTSGNKRYALYDAFSIASEKAKYELSIGTYSGNAGDSLSAHRGAAFSTKDRDNDSHLGNCARSFKGGWWYAACHAVNLNGLYHLGPHTSYADGVHWKAFKGYHYSLKRTSMKFRPVNFKTK